MEAINVNTLKISNNGIIIFKSSRFYDYLYSYNVLIVFFKNYLTAVPDCTASRPLLHDIELQIPQHFRYSFDGCLKEASLLVN